MGFVVGPVGECAVAPLAAVGGDVESVVAAAADGGGVE